MLFYYVCRYLATSIPVESLAGVGVGAGIRRYPLIAFVPLTFSLDLSTMVAAGSLLFALLMLVSYIFVQLLLVFCNRNGAKLFTLQPHQWVIMIFFCFVV